MRRYIPDEVAAKLEAARGQRVEGERRIVTMLFCDVKGSTAAAEKFDPEEWAEVMNEVFDPLIAPVYRYEGVVARLMGDAILAFFGAPIAHEDDPQRAILAALEIVDGVRALRDRLRRAYGIALDVRVGLNTGLVVVGEIGSDLRVEYTAMGDAVNLAARMEQTAAPGTVQCTEATYRLTAPLFEWEALGEIAVKGKEAPVRAYRVLARRREPGRLRGIAGRAAPLVGRDAELALLRRALEAVSAGRGMVIFLVGEAGLGKSRLIEELRGSWSGAWRESRGVSYEATRPYGQFEQHLRQLCGIAEHDDADALRAKVAGTVAGDRDAAVVETLLGLAARGLPEGEELRREIERVLAAVWRDAASRSPAVFVFEDLHWADPASIDALRALLPLAREAPLLFLCASRPDGDAPSAELRAFATRELADRAVEIRILPLGHDDAGALVGALLPTASPDLRARILARAEGNPFFLEEVVRALLEHDGEGEATALPESVQGLLTARVDRLPEAARRTLQLAAVLGRTFERRALAAVAEDPELDAHLAALQRAELLLATDGSYAFRHALVHDAVYRTVLLRRRRALHARVGELLERTAPERVEDLAHHFYEAGSERALAYYTAAGDRAYRLYANVEAAAHYGRGIETARRHGGTSEQLLHLYTRRGRALELSARLEEALANYRELEAVASERADRSLELAALNALVTMRAVLSATHDPAEAQALSDRALTLARELHDRAAEAKILWNLMLLHAMSSRDAARAARYGEESLAIARELGLREQAAFTLNDLYHARMVGADLRGARAALEEARPLWQDLDNRPMLADNLAASSNVAYLAGEFDRALGLADVAHEIAVAINNLWGQSYSRRIVGQIYLERGEPARAVAETEGVVRLGEIAGLIPTRVITASDLALIYAAVGERERALAVSRGACDRSGELPRFRAYAFAVRARLETLEGDLDAAARALAECRAALNVDDLASPVGAYAPVAAAELALARGELAEALAAVDDALAWMDRTGVRAFIAEGLALKARVLVAAGHGAEARATLGRARQEATALGSRHALWRILVALGELEGDDALRAEARAIVERIAAQAGEFREPFLRLPEVRAALD